MSGAVDIEVECLPDPPWGEDGMVVSVVIMGGEIKGRWEFRDEILADLERGTREHRWIVTDPDRQQRSHPSPGPSRPSLRRLLSDVLGSFIADDVLGLLPEERPPPAPSEVVPAELLDAASPFGEVIASLPPRAQAYLIELLSLPEPERTREIAGLEAVVAALRDPTRASP